MWKRPAAVVLLTLAPACGGAEDPEAVRSPAREVPATEAPTRAVADSSSASSRPGATDPEPARERGTVLFLGTSLTEGYGLANAAEHAFPARVQERIDRAGLPFRVVNAGVGGDTSAGGLRRLEWLLRAPPRVLVIELGANDGLRGLDVGALRDNLLAVIGRTRTVVPEVEILLAGMRAPPNLGERYTGRFRAVFPEVARETGVTLIPFLLEGVGGIRALNQPDGIHPSAEGHEIIAETVWAGLEPVLRGIAPNDPR